MGLFHVQNFLSENQCQNIITYLKKENVIKKYDYNFAEAGSPEALHFMTTHFLFAEDTDKSQYKAKAAESIKQYQALSHGSNYDSVTKIDQELKSSGYEVLPAREDGFEYSRAMIRSLKEGVLLHADYAPFLKKDWEIKNL